MRRLTAAEIALQEGEAARKERDEWADAARRSFQNQRSRSLSRSRTKSIAKASNAAITASTAAGMAAEEKERERARRHAAVGGGPSSVAHTAPSGSAPPTASSNGVGDDGRPRTAEKGMKGVSLKGGMDIIAQRAFSQGHVPVVSASSSVSHSRHHSGETLKEKTKEPGHRHRRSESWSRSAVKRAKSVCVDPEAVSPAVERVLFTGAQAAPPEPAREEGVLNITSQNIRPQTPTHKMADNDDVEITASAVGIAIGTPPLDSLFNEPAKRIDHPYGSALNSPTRPSAGPHPASPVLSALPTPLSMSDVASRHRLPPRASNVVSPPLSPHLSPRSKGLDAFVPTLASTHQETLSRESWLVYMDAMEENPERPFTAAEKGKGRAVVVEEAVPEEFEQQFPEDVEPHMDAHDSHLDPNSVAPLLRMQQNTTPTGPDLVAHLTKAFRHSTVSTGGDSEDDEHANMTFQAGATLTRLLSSRSVTATPRPALMRALSNPETPKKKEKLLSENESFSTVSQTPKRLPFPTFDSDKMPTELSPIGSDFRPKSDTSDPLSASLEGSWRKSVVSSEGVTHSQESSPKASPRALVNLDDLDGYSDLFYQAGPGSTGSRPRSGGSFKTVNSGGLVERNRRSEIITFGNKGASGGSSLERSLSSPESGRSPLGMPGTSTVITPQSYHAMPSFGEYGETTRGYTEQEPSRFTDPYLLKTWDPEEEDDNYRLVDSRPALLPRPVAPIHRYSTKLSVIEGSIDDHATASESTPDPTEAQSVRAVSPTSPTRSEARASMQYSSTLPAIIDSLGIPLYARRRRTSSERAVAADGAHRTSVVTNVSDQSRMSNLSEFPAPPVGSSSLVFTPATTMAAYFPPRPSSPIPVSPMSVEPPSPAVEVVDDDESSLSDYQHNLSAVNRSANSRSGSFRANRSTFGPESEITREWAEQEHPSTPTTEER
ncbi:hypothetical protein FRC18_010706 [Serendipita sp. 400]|nr:hypothetical protein FRC18_010706 [Serendipita sp. 400]